MPFTQSRYQQGLPNTDAIAVFGSDDMVGLAAADVVPTRTAVGDYCLEVAASKTVTIALNLGKLLQRTGMQGDYQEQFGTAAAVAGASSVANTGDPLSLPAASRPPFTGVTNLTPRTGNILKGVKILDFKVCYNILAVNMVALTCRVDKTVYADGVATAVTAVLASAANGLVATFAATPKVKTVSLAAAQQIFRVTDLSALTFEIGAQTDAGCTFRLQKVEVRYEYNFN